MPPTKEHILSEIVRTAQDNGGKALGRSRFEKLTGISEGEWCGRYWARWSDAVTEAGFTPNKLVAAHDEVSVLQKVAELAIELRRFPVASEMRLKRRRDPSFPDDGAVYDRFGSKRGLAEKLSAFAADRPEFAAVVSYCEPAIASAEPPPVADVSDVETGYVYLALMKVGREKRFKIGKADIVGRRARQIAVDLPEELELVHVIGTDDAYGIEGYWHRRFAEKRRGGEWFDLAAEDVRAFKRRKFM